LVIQNYRDVVIVLEKILLPMQTWLIVVFFSLSGIYFFKLDELQRRTCICKCST